LLTTVQSDGAVTESVKRDWIYLVDTLRVTESPRCSEISHMPNVEQIEDTVSKNQSLARCAQTFAHTEQFVQAQNLSDHLMNNNLA